MPEFIQEPARQLKVTESADVVVVGGGMAGISAAVCAARKGVKVLLLENMFGLGGLATLGNVTLWLRLCDGRGTQVIRGIAQELMDLSVSELPSDMTEAGFRDVNPAWKKPETDEPIPGTCYTGFNPDGYMLQLEKWLCDNDVDLLYGTRVCGVHSENGQITHLFIENKSGRQAVACKMVIDCSGDADVCALAGEKMRARAANVPAGWFYHLHQGTLHLNHITQKYRLPNEVRDPDVPEFRGENGRQLTGQLLAARKMIRERMDQLREKHPEDNIQLLSPPQLPCVRMTRSLVSAYTLSPADLHQWHEDAITLTGNWRKAGEVYAIPFRCLTGQVQSNLFSAGRCMSSDFYSWDATRGIACCTATGQAVGTAAALLVQDGSSRHQELSITKLQHTLQDDGVLLDPKRLNPKEAKK